MRKAKAEKDHNVVTRTQPVKLEPGTETALRCKAIKRPKTVTCTDETKEPRSWQYQNGSLLEACALPSNPLCRDGCAWLHAHVWGEVVWVCVIPGGHAIHHQGAKSLGLGDWTILMCQQQGLQVHNFFTKLSHCSSESIVLRGEQFNLGLKVGQPLLLALPTFERRNPVGTHVSASYSSNQ